MSERGGYLLIINIQNGDRPRLGSNNDAQNLKDTFELMNAKVDIVHDLAADGLKKKIDELKEKDFSSFLYVAVAYLSHGGEDGIVELTTKDIMIIQKTILFPLCRLPALDGKLKWLIMQTCRGNYDFIVQKAEGPEDEDFFPFYCAKFFATTEGLKAYRSGSGPNAEAFFIRALCNRLRSEYETHDILSIMNNVRDDVIAEIAKAQSLSLSFGEEKEQLTCSEDNFGSKKFYIRTGFRDN